MNRESRESHGVGLHVQRLTASGNPVGEKDIELSRRLGLTIRYPDQAGTIRREHRETVELSVEGEPLEALTVLTDHVEMKTWSASLAFRFDIR